MSTSPSPMYTRTASPIGELVLVSDGEALTGLYMPPHRHAPQVAVTWRCDPAPFRDVLPQLDAYFAGDSTTFDVPVRPRGTPFQKRVWAALLRIPYGSTRTYGELARQVGRPGAARAVGLANGRNPVSVVVPCHRVIGAGGALSGYGGGVDKKRQLLDLETGVMAARGDRWPAAHPAVP
jgi:methylated-DNA-[protein]-cysteine S-methyltransferase